MLDTHRLVLVAFTMLAGSTVASTLGFGLGMTVSPILLLILSPLTVVITVNIIGATIYGIILVRDFDHIKLREVGPLTCGGLLGVPFGVLALNSVSTSALRISITVIIMALVVVATTHQIGQIKSSGIVASPLGFIVGAMTASLGVGAPLIVLFILQHSWPPHTTRASLSLYNFLIMIAGIVGYGITGLITTDRISLLLIVSIPVATGYVLGNQLINSIDNKTFRKGAVGLISITSLIVLAREVYYL